LRRTECATIGAGRRLEGDVMAFTMRDEWKDEPERSQRAVAATRS
jgi:hypothetical protein